MEPLDSLKDRLLSQDRWDPSALEHYRKETKMALEAQEGMLRREKRVNLLMWPLIVLMSTAFLVLGGYQKGPAGGLWFGILACFWFLFGSVFLLKLFANVTRVELLKEIKGLEIRVLELREALERESK